VQLAGKFELPGGKVEVDEQLASACAREITEELACSIAIREQLGSYRLPGGTPMVVFLADLVGARPTSSTSHDQLIWISPAQYLEIDWIPADLVVVHDLLAHGEK
jgi:8-oxo-dGTP diphosphatase